MIHNKWVSVIVLFLQLSVVKPLFTHEEKENRAKHTQQDYNRLLYKSVITADADKVLYALSHGADADYHHASGWGPLHLAVFLKRTKIISLLLQYNVNVNREIVYTLKNQQGTISKHYGTPLQIACEKGSYTIARLLLDKGASVNDKGTRNRAPLFCAVPAGNLELVKLLVNHGADPRATDSDGNTVLHCASQYNRKEFAAYFLSLMVNINAHNNEHNTPLHLALLHNHPGLAAFLIKNKAECNVYNKDRELPLHLAIKAGLLNLAYKILAGTRDLNSKDRFGQTCLYLAVFNNYTALTRMLVQRGASIHTVNPGGVSLFYLSLKNRNRNLSVYFLQSGIKIEPHRVDLYLLLALDASFPQIAESILTGNSDHRIEDTSIIFLSLKKKYFELNIIILDRMSNYDISDTFGKTLFFNCIKYYDVRSAERVLQEGILIKDPKNVMFMTVERGYIRILKVLIARGINVNPVICNERFDCKTPLDLAKKSDVVKLMRSVGAKYYHEVR